MHITTYTCACTSSCPVLTHTHTRASSQFSSHNADEQSPGEKADRKTEVVAKRRVVEPLRHLAQGGREQVVAREITLEGGGHKWTTINIIIFNIGIYMYSHLS